MDRPFNSRKLAARLRTAETGLVRFLDLPPDAVMNLPRLTLLGNSRLIVENHRGLLVYNRDLIRIKVTIGEIEVDGEDLMLRAIRPEALVVEGNIRKITLAQGGGR
ncbi:MAG: sporulation protein YqfC [Thermoanaerobacteraceae bacterium]|uniref:sporulation protein YqfC n=1 Tax=Thermanaeromonas sp. C210 TaxID=2731925 RepID=UPI00155C866B|nr:sporulation protein YqfC [Thermanaeromonas sp. C210]MBE3580137.1 sporulation protein YqfC [Thermoanaerobacteraceae bacterium]GFN22515.1 sporulation protein YqfC [Thermanaeromonas sp. C210]